MKNTKLLLLGAIIALLQNNGFAQSTNGVGGNVFVLGNFLGWNNTNGANILPFRTNNVQRLQINGTTTLWNAL
ncbi:MAG: hypothetical protein HYX39_05500 [Bacteroidetes bacterium]|nr:hypothetical protein [Bacteroidota bacterium]